MRYSEGLTGETVCLLHHNITGNKLTNIKTYSIIHSVNSAWLGSHNYPTATIMCKSRKTTAAVLYSDAASVRGLPKRTLQTVPSLMVAYGSRTVNQSENINLELNTYFQVSFLLIGFFFNNQEKHPSAKSITAS